MASRMADSELRTVLQQQVFNGDQERLIIPIPVMRSDDRRRRVRHICLAVRRDHGFIYVVKQDKRTFRKKPEAWSLVNLREIDGHSSQGTRAEPALEFDLIFQEKDKRFKYDWTATTVSDKNAFLVQLSKLHRRYGEQAPLKFTGLDEVLEDELARAALEVAEGKERVMAHGVPSQKSTAEKEQTLTVTQKEQEDLEHVFELSRRFDFDGEVLVQSLTQEMSQMESANVHDLMNTHNDIDNICRLIDQSLAELNKMDEKITKYHGLVGDVSSQVTMMDETGHKLKLQNRNIKKLIHDIGIVLETLEFQNSYRLILMDGNIMDPAKLPEILEAASVLSRILKASLPVGFDFHPAVIKQKRTLDNLRKTFGNRVAGNLTNVFTAYSNSQHQKREGMTLPSHRDWCQNLIMFAPAVRWMKENISDPPMYQNLLQTYTEKLGDLYRREQSEFFDKVKARVIYTSEANNSTKVNPEYWLGWEEEVRLTASDFTDYRAHLEPIKVAFHQVAKTVLDEQSFLVEFFSLSTDNELATAVSGSALNVQDSAFPTASGLSLSASAMQQRPGLMHQPSMLRTDTPLKMVLRQLFKNVDGMLGNIIASLDKGNRLTNLGLLVIILEILVEVEPVCPYLAKCYGSMVITVKKNFDGYIREQVMSIMNAKVPRKVRFGPLPFVCNFEHFARLAENFFANSQRRIELDKAYGILIRQGIFEGVNRIANHKDCKLPPEVVFLENYHRLSDILSRLKIASLEELRTDIRKGHNLYRKSYVQIMLGKPLLQVQVFFDGVDAKIQTSGVKAHEVGFRQEFSKTELRRVLALYPRAVVKKGLEQLYKKVEKQLSDEENMLQAVWRDMQQEFIEQYKNYTELIDACYPDSKITFAFAIDDILKIFEEIAASH
ncbi:Exocyst complex component 1 [Hypsibius exemplaris]|uniref:Exocyst complex component 1 n=1 Tax=Hypsibius exemplaris TaxID=2072580 RepID=A0A1W0XAF2_HYPEX|nr:Exocyst complex component 1 [Hypsibius exemplaris]